MARWRFVLLTLFTLALLWAPVARADQAVAVAALSRPLEVVPMRLDVESFASSAVGVLEPQAEWTTKAIDNIHAALRLRERHDGFWQVVCDGLPRATQPFLWPAPSESGSGCHVRQTETRGRSAAVG